MLDLAAARGEVGPCMRNADNKYARVTRDKTKRADDAIRNACFARPLVTPAASAEIRHGHKARGKESSDARSMRLKTRLALNG